MIMQDLTPIPLQDLTSFPLAMWRVEAQSRLCYSEKNTDGYERR